MMMLTMMMRMMMRDDDDGDDGGGTPSDEDVNLRSLEIVYIHCQPGHILSEVYSSK